MKSRTLAASFLLTICAACASPEPESETRLVRPAKIIEVTRTDRIRSIQLPALIGAADNSILTFQVSGQLTELEISEGTEVERGTILARLDQRSFRNAVASARASFANAQAEFERAERLIAENAISQSLLEQRRSQRDISRAALDSAQKQLDDTVIRAPFSGVVADIHAEAFESVSPQQPILTFQSGGDAEAIVQVPASLIIDIDQLEVIETTLRLDAAPDVQLDATFVESASVADAVTQTFEARFAFTPPETLVILPGMTGLLDGSFRSAQDDQTQRLAITLPVSAVLAEAGATYVWVVEPSSMTVSRQSVDVGPGLDETITILSGLEEGDLVVGAGGAYLFEGAEIRAYEG